MKEFFLTIAGAVAGGLLLVWLESRHQECGSIISTVPNLTAAGISAEHQLSPDPPSIDPVAVPMPKISLASIARPKPKGTAKKPIAAPRRRPRGKLLSPYYSQHGGFGTI
jgi:hypothetical protein